MIQKLLMVCLMSVLSFTSLVASEEHEEERPSKRSKLASVEEKFKLLPIKLKLLPIKLEMDEFQPLSKTAPSFYRLARFFVTTFDDGKVYEIINGKISKQIIVDPFPRGLVAIGDRFYIINYRSNSVAELTNYKITSDIDVGYFPYAITARGKDLYTLKSNDRIVSKITDGKVVQEIDVGKESIGISCIRGQLYVFYRDRNTVGKIVDDKKIEEIEGDLENLRTFAAMGNRLYALCHGKDSLFEVIDGVITEEIKVGNSPSAVIAVGERLYVTNHNDCSISEVINGRENKRIKIGTRPTAIVALEYQGRELDEVISRLRTLREYKILTDVTFYRNAYQ